jgi:hypothetical protein
MKERKLEVTTEGQSLTKRVHGNPSTGRGRPWRRSGEKSESLSSCGSR